jgi:hypothetical protein
MWRVVQIEVHMRLLIPAALSLLAAAPVAAQSDAPLASADRVAAVLIGFTADGTAMVEGNLTASVARNGAGSFAASIEETGASVTFEVVETTPCVFDATYTNGDLTYRVRLDTTKVKAYAFEAGDAQAGYATFQLTLDAAEGAVTATGPDGETRDGGNRNTIGTSLTLDELNAHVAALQEACPAA